MRFLCKNCISRIALEKYKERVLRWWASLVWRELLVYKIERNSEIFLSYCTLVASTKDFHVGEFILQKTHFFKIHFLCFRCRFLCGSSRFVCLRIWNYLKSTSLCLKKDFRHSWFFEYVQSWILSRLGDSKNS